MADLKDLFLFGDYFDAILGILENEEELDEHFKEAADEIQLQSVVCQHCHKKCKSKSGLKRHITVKHKNTRQDNEKEDHGKQESDLSTEAYSRIVEKAKAKICDSKVYPQLIRDEIRSYNYNSLQDITTELSEIQKLYKRLIKSGKDERFYTAFYSTIALHAVKHFEGLSRNSATLLSTKVADCMLAQSKEKVENHTRASFAKLSDEEKAGLEYIGGYVLHKLHNKHVNAKKSSESEQAVSLLKSGKLEDQTASDQRLTASLNRGGLWTITRKAQSVFERTEHYFREATSHTDLKTIPIASVISRSIHDIGVVAAHGAMLSDSELMIDSNVAKDVLHNIVLLYVRVRSFSFAKDIIQKHKIKSKQLKSKALHKEISRSSTENDQERQN
ncbi:uncharacterized protein LOC116291663 [Actinia tenebrosa]|uniref:Uncharacterized protein LOC116291663 n=1 Tax=Actinia tenebrosa TaxID=6105 RepID=A0A6P8HPW9_ACTTE|nr:uncharacterized protein LOC116291663 [Actinia tenebrosa]